MAEALAPSRSKAQALIRAGRVLVDDGSPTRFLANAGDPGIGLDWVERVFDDGAWSSGRFGVGRESGQKGGTRLLIARSAFWTGVYLV